MTISVEVLLWGRWHLRVVCVRIGGVESVVSGGIGL